MIQGFSLGVKRQSEFFSYQIRLLPSGDNRWGFRASRFRPLLKLWGRWRGRMASQDRPARKGLAG